MKTSRAFAILAALAFTACSPSPYEPAAEAPPEQTRSVKESGLVQGVGVTPTIYNPGFEFRESGRPLGWNPAPCNWTWPLAGVWGNDIESARFLGEFGSVAIFTDVWNCQVWSTMSTTDQGFGVFRIDVRWKVEQYDGYEPAPVSVGTRWKNDAGSTVATEGSGFPGLTCTDWNDPSTCSNIPVVSGEWTTASFTSYKPVAATRFELRLEKGNGAGTVYFDEVTITRIK